MTPPTDTIPVIQFPDASPYVKEAAASTRTELEARYERLARATVDLVLHPRITREEAIELLALHLRQAHQQGACDGIQEAREAVLSVMP